MGKRTGTKEFMAQLHALKSDWIQWATGYMIQGTGYRNVCAGMLAVILTTCLWGAVLQKWQLRFPAAGILLSCFQAAFSVSI